MSKPKFRAADLAQIAGLADRAGKISRRNLIRTGTFVVPALSTFAVARESLGGTGSPGNNGVGNGLDPQPPGNPPVNDGPGTGPGNPGNQP